MELHRDGTAFVAILDHNEAQTVGKAGDVLAAAIPPAAPVLAALSTLVETMDFVGGDNGVEISGAEDSTYFMVLPRGNGVIGKIAALGVSVASFVANYMTPAGLITNLVIPGVGHIFGASEGEIHCDENNVGDEETFALVASVSGKIGILSFNGFWTCDHDDSLVYANRTQMLADESFSLVHTPDGKIQLQGDNGRWVSADRNLGGKRVSCNRTEAGEWETWTMHSLGDGTVALQESEGNYASVAP